MADVVERLEAQARQERRVADDDRDPLQRVADVAGGREALRDREAGPGVPAVHDVVGGLAPAREAADAVDLAQGVEPVEAAGEQLVRVGLVPRVPDDAVARRLEQPVERDRELDDAERRAEVAAGHGDGADDRLAQLGREPLELGVGEAAEVGGSLERVEDGHGDQDYRSRPGVTPVPYSSGGVLGSHVHGDGAAVRRGHQLLDAELRLGEEPLAAALEGDRALVLGDRRLERQAARLERRDGPLVLGEGLVVGERLDVRVGSGAGGLGHDWVSSSRVFAARPPMVPAAPSLVAGSSPAASVSARCVPAGASAGSRRIAPSPARRTIA